MISSSDMVAATATALETAHEALPALQSWLAVPRTSRLLRSRLLTQLGVRHGFTTRLGGVSSGRFASLNLGQTWGDDLACASENLRLVAQDAGFDTQRLCQVQQVHGKLVLPLSQPERRVRQADGMATADALVLGVHPAGRRCRPCRRSSCRLARHGRRYRTRSGRSADPARCCAFLSSSSHGAFDWPVLL